MSAQSQHSPIVTYRIDAEDRIIWYDDAWREFALANEYPQWEVFGTVLWQHITDRTTAEIYRVMVAQARSTGRALSVPFRCDGPDLRRHLQLHIAADRDRVVTFTSVTLRQEHRPRVALLDVHFPRSHDLLRMCSWCKRVEVRDWVEVEHAVSALQLFDAASLPLITHAICPTCEQQWDCIR